MLNYVGDGEILNIIPLVALTSGELKIIGGIIVVPQADIPANELGAVVNGGEFTGPKATGFAPAVGDVMYWDEADKEFNSDTSNPAVGHYTAAALSADTACQGKLLPLPFASVSSLDARLDDIEEQSVKTQGGVGDQVNLTDTNPHVHTEKTSVAAGVLEADDYLIIEGSEWVDDQDSTPQITVEILVGSTVIDTLVIGTAADNDCLWFRETLKLTAVGTSLTAEIKSEGGIKDSTWAAHNNLQKAKAITASSTAGFDITVRVTSASGHADNKVTMRELNHWIRRAA